MIQYENGNVVVQIEENGTRTLSYNYDIQLEYPLNIDIRVSNKCAFGFNPKTEKAFCSFCHESARTDGKECDYEKLQNKLKGLPRGIELAIGANEITQGLIGFLKWNKEQGYISNLTINQGHISRDYNDLIYLINNGLIYGLGVSYRASLKWNLPEKILHYPNLVLHVIAGIDDLEQVAKLADKGIKKILVLGEKDFGFNSNKVNLNNPSHQYWRWHIRKLFDLFEIVSFDNLGIEQLDIKRFFLEKDWELFYQHEYSMYINAVDECYSPSSRHNKKVNWDILSIKDFFEIFILQ